MIERVVRQLALLVALTLAAALGWMARGYRIENLTPSAASRDAAGTHASERQTTTAPVARSNEPADAPLVEPPEVAVPTEILAPISEVTATVRPPNEALVVVPSMRDADAPRSIIIPVAGVDMTSIRDQFDEPRGDHRHEALDIMAPRGTPVMAADDGVVKKLFTSAAGGLTVYEFDPDERFCYYYAHLDRYADGLHEGQHLVRGQIIGYVGSTGNAADNAPHLHFALIRLDPDKRWWKGTYVNPYPLLVAPRTR
jgi:murein DD-endopeptidase MepM/ murein hydrolase activator NlpD